MISETTVKTRGDQPRTSVWSDSMTGLRPRRRSLHLLSIAVAIRPMRSAATVMPKRVTTKVSNRRPQPESPVNVPASRTRTIVCYVDSKKPGSVSSPMSARNTVMMKAPSTITTRMVAQSSQAMIGRVPREMALSNR